MSAASDWVARAASTTAVTPRGAVCSPTHLLCCCEANERADNEAAHDLMVTWTLGMIFFLVAMTREYCMLLGIS